MSVTTEQLRRAIETSFFVYPPIPHRMDALPVAGVRGRVTPLSNPLLNLVGAATLDEGNVAAAIEQVSASGRLPAR